MQTRHVLLDTDGLARPYRHGKDRKPGHLPIISRTVPGRKDGEAAHRRHRC